MCWIDAVLFVVSDRFGDVFLSISGKVLNVFFWVDALFLDKVVTVAFFDFETIFVGVLH